MKRKLFLLLCALLTMIGVQNVKAQDAGTYYIQNVSTGKWLAPGNDWGTQASALSHADYWKLAKISNGVYTLESVVSNGGTNYYLTGTYCDGAATNFTFNAVAGKASTYTIANSSGGLLTVSENIVNVSGSDATAEVSQWKLWSIADMSAGMAAATSENPFDATYLIKDHDLGRNNRDYSSWSNTGATAPKTASDSDWGDKDGKAKNGSAIYSIEAYQKTFDVKQTLSSIPNGRYALRVNGFYRQDGSNANLPYLYAGSANVTLPVRTGTENDMQAAAESFVNGNYLSDRATTLVTNNSLTVGVKTTGNSCWAIFKNFHLEYYGNAISYYSPAEFTNGDQAAAGDWKYYDVNAGWYRIASNAAITFYYSQDDSEDADNTESVAISQNGYTYLKLAEGKLYFKSSANATLTLTEGFVANDDITAFLLTNPNFTGNADGWEGSPSYQSKNAEKFNTTFDVYQTVSDLPAGYYRVKAQAFDRQTDVAATYESPTSVSKAYLYAGNASKLVKRIYDDASTTQKNGGTNELSFTKGETTVYIPSMPGAGEKYFDAGLYDNELLMYHGGGDLRIGIKKYVKTSNDWCLFDNFRVVYAGNTPSNGANLTSLISNPSFETGDKTGWSTNAGHYIQSGSDLSNKVGTYYSLIQGKTTNRNINQTVNSLPAGKYVLSANARANSDAGSVTLNMGAYSSKIPVGENAGTYTVAYETEVNESSASVQVALSGGSGDLRRCYVDNFTLTYYETLPDVSITDLTSSAMAADVRAALTSASSTYNSSKTAANYNALQTAIVNAKVSIAEYAAKTGADADWTGIIRNPSFEPNDYRTGWTVTVSSGSSTGEGARSKDGGLGDGGGSKRFFIWTANAGAATVKQTLNELPSGNYKLSAYMASAAGDVFTLSAGSTFSKVIASDGNATLVEAYFTQASTGNIEISATHSGSWFDVDNFHLTSDPTLPESITGVSGNMNSTVASAQTTAVNAYNAESGQTFANMLAAQTAMNNARASILVYNDISNLVTTYAERVQNNLDDVGQAAYDASTVEGKITSGTYVTAAEAEADLKAAYVEAVKAQTTPGTDMTLAITNPSFESATGVSTTIAGWTNEDNKTLQTQNNTDWAKVGTYYAERWHSTGDKNIYQLITGLHAGAYVLTAKAYAGDATAKVYAVVGETEYTIDVTATEDYSVLFDYDGTSDLKIGFSGNMGNDANTGWICVDNFRLTYSGESQPDLPLYTTEPMNATAKANANTAINNYNANKTSENYTAAESAIAVAEASKTAYNRASLEGYKSRMGELLAKTNVYTEAAYNKWYAHVDDNYANGIYTDEEVVTLTAAGACQGATEDTHKKANRIDDVLLSTWTIGGEQCSDYDKSLYINTWSLEGNIDGSGFQTPFFEYWTSDGNSLGEATMVGTVTGLEVSAEYSVDIWARVRQTNNQTKVANSITMQVGSGSAAGLTAGTQVGSSQFYIDHFTATGSTDESGNLTITIAVAANSNVSWLSFKDVAVSKQATTGDVQTYSGLINNDTELVPTTTAPIVDITEATFTGDISANFSSNANGFIIATAEQKAALDDVKNVVVDNTCDNLVLTDGTDFVAPGEFTATSANYSRAGIKLSKDRYATVYLPYAFSTDGLKVMEYTSYEDGVLTFTPVDVTEPSTPYLVRIADDGEEDVVEDYGFSGSGPVSATDASTDEFKGTYNAQTLYANADGYNYYGFSAKNGDFRQASVSGNACAAFRAYLKLSDGANARVAVRFDDDKTTGIVTLDADGNINGLEVMKDGKYIIENKIIIVKNGVKYDANGKKLN